MRYPIAPQIDWDQTDVDVKINVWIPGVEVGDLRCTLKSSFLTVEVEPYLLDADLHGDIEVQESTLEILNQGMRFWLRKVCLPAHDYSLLLRRIDIVGYAVDVVRLGLVCCVYGYLYCCPLNALFGRPSRTLGGP
jgi:hypothetical protein